MYDIHYGIYDHLGKKDRLFATVGYHEREEPGSYKYMLTSTLKLYHVSNLNKYFGISLNDFMNMTPEVANYAIESAKEIMDVEAKHKKDIISDLENMDED